jgi:uncharacterized protein YnzC (UPF0291/DUF896 family)
MREYIENYLKTDTSRSNKSNLIKLLISDEQKFNGINNFISFGTFKQKFYHYLKNQKKKPTCLICNGEVNWCEKNFIYRETCSSKCSGKLNLFRKSDKKVVHPILKTKEEYYNYFMSNRIKITESSITKHYPEIVDNIKYINFVDDFNQRVYCYLKNIDHHPTCKNCPSEVKFDTFSKGFHDFCSVKCSSNSDIKKESIRKTVNLKYGVDNIGEVTREKAKNTMFEKYGNYFSSTDQFRSKLTEFNLEKFGKKHYFQTDEFKNKSKDFYLNRFGVESSMQLLETINKVLQTKKERGLIFRWSDEEIKSYEKYRQKVTYLSGKSYLENIKVINPEKLNRGHLTHHLDHIYPVILGFLNNIDAELISNYKNLQLLPHLENRSKGERTDMSIEDFYTLIGS